MNARSTFIVAALLFLTPALSDAQEKGCNCKSFPFKPDPPCFAQCTGVLLNANPPKNLEKYLQISPALAQKISARDPQGAKVADLMADLSASERQELTLRLQSLDQEKVDQLSRTLSPKETSMRGWIGAYEVKEAGKPAGGPEGRPEDAGRSSAKDPPSQDVTIPGPEHYEKRRE